MKPLIIYHDHCTDGFGAAFAAWLKFGDDAEYLPMSYGNEDDFWSNDDGTFDSTFAILNREVYIVDFSFPRWIMEGLCTLAGKLVWLDHHKTAFEMWTGGYQHGDTLDSGEFGDGSGSRIILDDNRSGAMIAWEFFHPDTPVPLAIQHIDDRDRWQFKMVGSKEFHEALASYKPWTFETWYELLNDENYATLFTEGSAILRAHTQNVQSIVSGGRMSANLGEVAEQVGHTNLKGLAATCPPYAASDVGHELANQSGTFGLCWYMSREGKVRCSLRSNGNYDVSAIAKVFGGGGHKNAAGFETDMATLMGWLGA